MKNITIDLGEQAVDLLSALREKTEIASYCGGRGTCGKCKLRFLSVPPEATERDRAFFSKEELAAGYRLACKARCKGRVTIQIDAESEEEMEISAAKGTSESGANDQERVDRDGLLSVAVDIGTTTLAAALVRCDDGKLIDVATSVNHQRRFGADVLTRIDAANRGSLNALQQSILDDLAALSEKLGVKKDDIEFVIAGNSTMQHILQGLPCETLGVAPFTPVDISLHKWQNMLMMPGISTYVGADITSGIVASGMDKSEEICLLVDLGTNGEMVIGNREKLLAASTAAGPAFEGGNIQCGIAGIPGAICEALFKEGTVSVRTIGDEKPCGICGTGVLEIVYELLKQELIDESGMLDEDYFEDGYPLAEGIVFTAKDVREVQLAKAAIRAGIETLLLAYGITADEIGTVYLAGGFGERIDIQKAIGIGLLPEAFSGKVQAVGNSALKGAILLASGEVKAERFADAARRTEEVQLAANANFQTEYMEQMSFPEQE